MGIKDTRFGRILDFIAFCVLYSTQKTVRYGQLKTEQTKTFCSNVNPFRTNFIDYDNQHEDMLKSNEDFLDLQIEANKKKTKNLFRSFFIVFLTIGVSVALIFALLSKDHPVLTFFKVTLVFLIIATIHASISYWGMNGMLHVMTKGKRITKKNDPELYYIVEDMAMMAYIPVPQIYISEDPAPNAFTSGREPENASITITSGLRDLLTPNELRGVIAHEIAHIASYDIRVNSVAVSLVSCLLGVGIAIIQKAELLLKYSDEQSKKKQNVSSNLLKGLAYFILPFGLILKASGMPFVKVIQNFLSSDTEFVADRTGAKLSMDPESLVRALGKIEGTTTYSKTQDHPAAALYITKPKTKKESFYNKLYDTHPEKAERIKRLRELNI